MLRKLALVLLLPAMLLNGLWMVCQPQDQGDSPASAKESADCIRICAALEAALGEICFLFPGHPNASITIVDYGPAIVPDEVLLQPMPVFVEFEEQLPSAHGSPFVSNSPPPPKA
jgi:hypothetical protein